MAVVGMHFDHNYSEFVVVVAVELGVSLFAAVVVIFFELFVVVVCDVHLFGVTVIASSDSIVGESTFVEGVNYHQTPK